MKCSNCGAEIEKNESKCKECGTEFFEETEVVDEKKVGEDDNSKVEKRKYILLDIFDFKTAFVECIRLMLGVFLKPITYFKSGIEEYSDIRKTGILVLLVSIIRVFINLISSMISTIFMKEINFWTGASKLSISFVRLTNLNYFDLIFKQFFGFIIVVAAVAGIYYVVSLIMKKTTNYFRLVAITTVSFVSFIIVSTIISTIVSYIYAPASLFLVIASFIYSMFTFIAGIDNEVKFDDSNFKVYFHAICLTIIIIVAYYVFSNMLFTSLVGLLK